MLFADLVPALEVALHSLGLLLETEQFVLKDADRVPQTVIFRIIFELLDTADEITFEGGKIIFERNYV